MIMINLTLIWSPRQFSFSFFPTLTSISEMLDNWTSSVSTGTNVATHNMHSDGVHGIGNESMFGVLCVVNKANIARGQCRVIVLFIGVDQAGWLLTSVMRLRQMGRSGWER